MTQLERVLVIIPAFNEEANIEAAVEGLIKSCPQFDYIVVNDDLETCVEEVHRLVEDSRRMPVRRKAFIEEIRNELKMFVKGEA